MYGTPGGSASAHTAVMSDVPADDADALVTLEDCTDEYDDTELSVPFSSVAFSSSLAPSRDLWRFWVADSACSINSTAFRSDFVTFAPPSAPSRVGGVGVDVMGRGEADFRGFSHAQCGFPFGWHLVRPFTAHSMRCTPPTCHFAMHSTLAASLVSVGCNRTAVVNSFSLLTLTLACSWCPPDWVC
jgi:hypothetical protein